MTVGCRNHKYHQCGVYSEQQTEACGAGEWKGSYLLSVCPSAKSLKSSSSLTHWESTIQQPHNCHWCSVVKERRDFLLLLLCFVLISRSASASLGRGSSIDAKLSLILVGNPFCSPPQLGIPLPLSTPAPALRGSSSPRTFLDLPPFTKSMPTQKVLDVFEDGTAIQGSFYSSKRLLFPNPEDNSSQAQQNIFPPNNLKASIYKDIVLSF